MSDELSPEVFDAVCRQADQAARAQERLAQANTEAKNELLLAIADALDEHAADIEAANALDMLESKENGMDAGKLDRLLFDVPRVDAAAQGVRHVATLPDPVGEIVRGYNLPNGLRLTQTRVPMGVIGMIYEARPNVTVDVASLCLKSGNAALLRGGHAAERTNAATLGVIAPVLEAHGFESALVQSVDQYGRAGATAMMEARGHIDVLVPRGGAGLIQAVVRNSKVPVIETGAGNVHIYIDKSGDLAKAIPIIINAKTQRVGVCNAAEKLLVHKDVAAEFLPRIAAALAEANVVLQADTTSYDIISGAAIEGLDLNHATEEDWDTEYLALKMGIKVVSDLDAAIDHINTHSTGHTESIIAEDYAAIEEFTKRIDSAVVMVNASTRFTDGGVFGFERERRAWHLHAEDARTRSHGIAGDDHHQVDRLRNRTGARMNEDGNMNTTADTANKASELRPDIDLNDPKLGLKIAAERLSIVRYVFLVQIEDGIASAAQRASLEYADAVLIGWPETDSPGVADLDDAQLKIVREHMELMEGYIGKYSQMEHDGDLDGMTDTLIRITERVAEVRRLYQPDFPLPTFAEIRRVVQDEWDEDMGKIDHREDNPTAGEIEEETESADDAAGEGDQA